MNILKKCNLCPRNCLVDRYNSLGYCKQSNKIRIAKAALTYFEEPCISNSKGSGTIFFSGCNLGCVFCQNKDISKDNYGKDISIKRLSEKIIIISDSIPIMLLTMSIFFLPKTSANTPDGISKIRLTIWNTVSAMPISTRL